MQIQDFGLTFGSNFSDLKTDCPSGRYVLFANGVPWYEIRELNTGFLISVSAKMAARQNAGLHPFAQNKDSKITRCIVDAPKQSLSERVALIKHVIEQRLNVTQNRPLLNAVQHWIDGSPCAESIAQTASDNLSLGELDPVTGKVTSGRVTFVNV